MTKERANQTITDRNQHSKANTIVTSRGPDPEGEPVAFDYWLSRPKWERNEAAAILMGFDPSTIIKPFDPETPYWQLCEALDRQFSGQFPVLFVSVISWAKAMGYSLSVELISSLNAYSEALTGAENTDPRVLTSMRTAILGMAIGGYGYNPERQRSPVPAEIVADIKRTTNATLSKTTLLNLLRTAADEIGVPDPDD